MRRFGQSGFATDREAAYSRHISSQRGGAPLLLRTLFLIILSPPNEHVPRTPSCAPEIKWLIATFYVISRHGPRWPYPPALGAGRGRRFA